MDWVDTHAHLAGPEFPAAGLEALVQRARDAGVSRIVSLGTNDGNNSETVAIAERFADVYAGVGWQPTDLDRLHGEMELSPEQLGVLRELAQHPKTVAIGEIGLDYFRLPKRITPEVQKIIDRQKNVFVQQLALAAELGLPCCIHQRGGTFSDCMELIAPYVGKVKMVLHCFVEDIATARRAIEMGCHISLTGIVTFEKAAELRETVRQLPAERLMVETDSPYLAPVPHFRKLCEPAYVVHTGMKVAELLGMSSDEFARISTQTARSFFQKMK